MLVLRDENDAPPRRMAHAALSRLPSRFKGVEVDFAAMQKAGRAAQVKLPLITAPEVQKGPVPGG
jgi:hypothetical protein